MSHRPKQNARVILPPDYERKNDWIFEYIADPNRFHRPKPIVSIGVMWLAAVGLLSIVGGLAYLISQVLSVLS